MDVNGKMMSPLGSFTALNISRPSRSSSPTPRVSRTSGSSSETFIQEDNVTSREILVEVHAAEDFETGSSPTPALTSSMAVPTVPRPSRRSPLDALPVSSPSMTPLSVEASAQISISNMQARKIKMATADAVEELINKLSVKISTDSDIKLLVDTIYQRDVLIAQQDMAMEKANIANERLEAKVSLLTQSEDKMASVLVEQRKLITSTLSFNSREKRLKLASRHSVTYLSTKPDNLGMKLRNCLAQVPSAELLPEIATDNLSHVEVVQSDNSVNQEEHDKQKEELARMVGVVENLSNKYSPKFARYGKHIPTNLSTRRKRRPAIVPKVFSSIWKLMLKPPPPVKRIQDLTPQVNLSGINFNLKKNLPRPSYYPLKGVSQNAELYSSTSYRDYNDRLVVKPAAFAERELPFGGFQGLKTDLGIIAMPSQIVHGFVWSEEEQEWVIAATRENMKKRD